MSKELERVVELCRAEGLRITRALRALLGVMLAADRPMTRPELAAMEGLAGTYDQTTVYRLLTRLEEHGLVRKLGFNARASFYSLQVAERHREYLICRECGRIETLKMACPVGSLQQRVAAETGYRDLSHELEFYGCCPACLKR